MTDTILRPDIRVEQNTGDHDRFSHYADKNAIMQSALTGKPVKALCGKRWVPFGDPSGYPVCPTCREIYEQLQD